MFGDNTILDIFRNYFGETIFGTLFILSIIYCLIRKQKYKKIILLVLVLLIVIVYNDAMKMLITNIAGEEATYYRFVWILPVTLVVAYVATDIVTKLKKNDSKVIFIIGIVFMFLIGSGASFTKMFSVPENRYNLPNDAIEVCEIIKQDYGESEKSNVEIMLEKRVAVPMWLESMLRTYDASISYGVSRWAYMYVQENGYGVPESPYAMEEVVMKAVQLGEQVDGNELRGCIDALGIKYLVTERVHGMENYFAMIGCNVVGYSENFVVYRVN